MTQELFLSLLQETLGLVLALSAPVLMTSLTVGVSISILQAVTQIQESTLTFVPKIFASIAVLVATAPWMLDQMIQHSHRLFALLIEIGQTAHGVSQAAGPAALPMLKGG